MELKSYQKKAINDLKSYLDCLSHDDKIGVKGAWTKYWEQKGVKGGTYHDKIKGVPNICAKVPTGGGKTFLACASIKPINDVVSKIGKTFVIWLVPSEAILTQTLKNLKNPKHPYRERLNADFNSDVEIFNSNDLLTKLNKSNLKSLNIAVLSFASIKINNKEMRKMYQQNGSLLDFDSFLDDKKNLEDIDKLSVINVIRNYQPIVIVDESHNATSDLSLEMLENLNASFIYELTATPKDSSNVIHYTNAAELKKENMVKLPVYLCNFVNVTNVIENAIIMRNRLESIAKAENTNLRPIVLFQAQSGVSDDAETFEKLKKKLVNIGIAENQIAIKTAKINEINKDLLSPDCEIRYIITINALKEGWDCPYAYILASIANKNSTTDVEQLIGRVLRQPNAIKYANPELNMSYVLTCSKDFELTARSALKGLNGAGFSEDDYRQDDFRELESMLQEPQELSKDDFLFNNSSDEIDSDENANSEFLDSDVSNIKDCVAQSNNNTKIDIFEKAKTVAVEYDKKIENTSTDLECFGDLDMKTSKIKFEVPKLPQFALLMPDFSDFFEKHKVLEKEDLENNFTLFGEDIKINFDVVEDNIYKIDLDEEDNLPKYKKLSQLQREHFKQYLKTASDETRNRQSINLIVGKLKDNALNDNDLKSYVERIVNNLSDEHKAKLLDEIDSYVIKIKNKISDLKSKYRESRFYDLLNKGIIIIKDTFSFPPILQGSKLDASRAKSLYEKELDDLNSLESKVLTEIASLDNVKWWHRNKNQKPGFCINAFTNHYPDFIICTERGNIVVVETKGDDRTNDDSKTKLKLGSRWADKAGDKYFYFMVFENSKIEGSLLVNEFIDTLREL